MAISASSTSARIWRHSALAVPPPDARIWVGTGMPAASIRSSPSRRPNATPSSTARARCATFVAQRQADEGAARQRIGVRAALAAEVGEEEEAAAAGRRAGGGVHQVRELRCRAPARPGTSAGCPPRRASPTSGASARARHGRRRAPARAARRAARSVAPKTTPDVPSESAMVPGRTAPTPTALAAWSPPPATTGVPARSPVAAAAAGLITPVTWGPSEAGGSQPGSISSAPTISDDQVRAARSKSSVPAPSALSTA